MPGSFASLHYHLVFGTRDRRPSITPDLAEPLHNYLAGIVAGLGGRAHAIGGAPDHVHILAGLDKNRAISAMVRDLKANSSRWVHQTHPDRGDFAWQDGYGAFTVGIKAIGQVKAYILRQAEHHRTTDFREEFIEFLRLHGIAYDERYV